MEREINKLWKKAKLPLKQNANDPEYYIDNTMRIVFSDNRKILDIEDIAENNIRLVEKEEAEWLIGVLRKYVKRLEDKE